MKAAVPIDGEQVNQHFGRSQQFAIAEIDNEQITSLEILNVQELQHNHEGLASVLIKAGVTDVIVGGIGGPALQALQLNGLAVTRGAAGKYREVLLSYAHGTLPDKNITCNHGDHHHHHH